METAIKTIIDIPHAQHTPVDQHVARLRDEKFVNIYEQRDMIKDSRAQGVEAVATIVSELWRYGRRSARERVQYADEILTDEEIGERELSAAAVEVLGWVKDLDASDVQQVRILPEEARREFDEAVQDMKDVLCRFIDESSTGEGVGYYALWAKRGIATLDGFADLRSRRVAMDRGEVPQDGLSHLDVLTELAVRREASYAEAFDVTRDVFEKDMLLPRIMSEDYAEAAMQFYEMEGSQGGEKMDTFDLRLHVMATCDVVRAMGSSVVEGLYDRCGIVNVANMMPRQLERMKKVVDQDPDFLEELQRDEVVLVIRDGAEDHNRALQSAALTYETDATLFFEIPRLQGGRRIKDMADMLKQRGIQPSVMVIAAHGSPEGYFRMGGEPVGPAGWTSLHQSGLVDIAQLMKPDVDGNCSIVFNSCSQDAALEGGPDDTTLTDMARELRTYDAAGSSERIYQIYGVNEPSGIDRSIDSATVRFLSEERIEHLQAGSGGDGPVADAVVERIVVMPSGRTYRHLPRERQLAEGEGLTGLDLLELPAFRRTGSAVDRDPPDDRAM